MCPSLARSSGAASSAVCADLGGREIRIELVDSLAAFAKLRDSWTASLAETARSALHVSFPWLHAWWETFGADHRMCVMVARAGERVVGLAPLMIEARRFGALRIPVLRLIGNDVSPRSDIVLIDRKAEVIDALVRAMLSLPWGWFRLGQVPVDSDSISLLKWHVPGTYASMELQQAFATATIPLNGSWAEYLAGKSRNFRRSLRRTGASAGQQVLREFPDDFHDWDRMIQDVERISCETWKHRAGTSLAARPRDWEFYRRIMREALAEGRMRGAFLYEAEEPVAFVISVGHGDKLYALKTGYREASADSAPGVGLIAGWLEREFQRRRWSVVDLDRITSHGDWKQRWAVRTDTVVSYYLFRRTWLWRTIGTVYRAKKWARRPKSTRSA